MNKVLFISESYLKNFSPIAGNVSNESLTSSIIKAQNKYILPVLGKPLYDKMVNDIFTAGSINGVTGNYRILLDDYITPALTEYSLYESVFNMAFKFQNKGIGRMNDQYMESIDLDSLKYIRSEILNTAQWHQERLSNYLCDNSTLFPEYNQYTPDLSPNPNTGTYNSGIYFKNKAQYNPNNPFSWVNPKDIEKF